jgi:hypothetical protein
MSISGGRNDTVIHNRFENNGAWGVIMVAFPDSGPPCIGGTKDSPLLGSGSCLYDEWGDAVINNSFKNDGFFGNPTNGDFEHLSLEAHPTSCFSGNTDASGHLNPEAAALEVKYPKCDGHTVPADLNIAFLNESVCDTQVHLPPFGCLPTDSYPRQQHIVMHPLPRGLKTMHNPCAGVPANPWCPAHKKRKHH